MAESRAEMFDRVRLMARVDTDWDLSDNDTAALRCVLAEAEAREAKHESMIGEIHSAIDEDRFNDARALLDNAASELGEDHVDILHAQSLLSFMVEPLREASGPTSLPAVSSHGVEMAGNTTDALTAAQVIEACRVALEAWQTHMKQPSGASANYGKLRESLTIAELETTTAIAKIAAWEAARK